MASNRSRSWLVAASVLLLAACGGGGDSAPQAGGDSTGSGSGLGAGGLAVVLEAPQRVEPGSDIGLRWQAQGGAERFTIEVQRADGLPFEAIDARMTGSGARFARGAAWRYDFPTAQVRVQACQAAGACVHSNVQPLTDALLAGVATLRPPPGGDGSGLMGEQLSLDENGDTLVAAAPLQRSGDASAVGRGAILPFARGDDGAWTREPIVSEFDLSMNFGSPHALSGDARTLAVADIAHGDEAGGRPWTGGVYVYVRAAQGPWQRQSFLEAESAVAWESLGRQLTLSHDGNRLLAQAAERAVLFVREGARWRQAWVFEGSTRSVLSGDGRTVAALVITGQPPSVGYAHPRAVRVFRACACSAGWRRVTDLESGEPLRFPDAEGDPHFGDSLAISHDGRVIAAGDDSDLHVGPDGGERRTDSRAGAVFVFAEGAAGAWERSKLKTRDAPAFDHLGYRVALSADGSVLAAAACGLAAGDEGVRRNHAATARVEPDYQCSRGGAAYVFERDASGRWVHRAAALPDPRASFLFFALAMSADASTLAFGVTVHDDAADDPSRVVVY